jgi:hypothetical protein
LDRRATREIVPAMEPLRTARLVGTLLLLPLVAVAEPSGWSTVATEPYLIRMRTNPGTAVKEIWVEGELEAEVRDIQAALLGADRFSKFMPYVSEARFLGPPEPDGSRFVYTRLDFGTLLSARDYVVRQHADQVVGPDGSGEFRNRWEAAPDRIPQRQRVVRLRVNEGSWHVVPRGKKSFATYRFMVDPGGRIPSFAANLGNKTGVFETFKAIEGEAQRRARERQRVQPQRPPPPAAEPHARTRPPNPAVQAIVPPASVAPEAAPEEEGAAPGDQTEKPQSAAPAGEEQGE